MVFLLWGDLSVKALHIDWDQSGPVRWGFPDKWTKGHSHDDLKHSETEMCSLICNI